MVRRSKRPTVTDVARAAGVCPATVSFVVNNKPGVRPALRAKVLAVMKKVGYVPHPAARQLSLSTSETIGFAIQSISPGWLLTVFDGVLHRAAVRGYHVITSVSTKPGDEFDMPMRIRTRASVDGLVWLDPRADPATVRKFKKAGIPFVMIQNDPQDPDVNVVSIDSADGAFTAVQHLLAAGYRRLMFMTGDPESFSSQRQLTGAMRAINESGATVPAPEILVGSYVSAVAVQALQSHLDAGKPLPEAIFAFNDDMAIALLRWFQKRGIRVPEQVALMGFDGIPEAAEYELTTIETPMRTLGEMSAQLLIDVIGNPSAPAQNIELKGRLRIAGSCGSPPKLRNAAST